MTNIDVVLANVTSQVVGHKKMDVPLYHDVPMYHRVYIICPQDFSKYIGV